MDKAAARLYYDYDNSGTVDFWRKGLDGDWLYEGCLRQVRKITTTRSTQQTIFRAKGNSLVLQSVAPKPQEIIWQADNRPFALKSSTLAKMVSK
jgi:hypothetical protein